jgi:hypothetical protein
VLSALRAKRGWPRVVALVLLFAFTTALAHVHPMTASADVVTASAPEHDDHSGHDHDGMLPNASSSCGYCAAVTGKFFLPPLARIDARLVVGATAPAMPRLRLPSAPVADLFRPPIRALG